MVQVIIWVSKMEEACLFFSTNDARMFFLHSVSSLTLQTLVKELYWQFPSSPRVENLEYWLLLSLNAVLHDSFIHPQR